MIADILYNIFIEPIEMLVEIIFSLMYTLLGHPAAAIVGVSLVVNLLVLPLYNKSDAMQEAERQKQKEMAPWLKHIRKTFKGDERYMMQQTYYRQQNYRPIHAIKGSLSLLLQIPFFMAAYNYLSSLSQLSGVSLWIIKDLSQPDALIQIGGLSLNLLPILMTAINIVSGAIYTRGFPLKDKIQLYGMAGVFLVLLYDSPSGLVFYWTLNNVFSLCKNLVLKVIPIPKRVKKPDPKPLDKKLFIYGVVAVTLLTGAVIPLSVISSSPTEFMSYNYGPVWLVINTLTVAAGFFCLWLSIFYYLAGIRGRNYFTYGIWILTVVCFIDFLFFGNDYGFISASLIYDEFIATGWGIRLINLGVLILATAATVLVIYRWSRIVKTFGVVLIAAAVGLSAYNLVTVESAVSEAELRRVSTASTEVEPIIPLSTTGKNVIVLMMDRAISSFIPEIMEEKSEVAEALAGFTYYTNTLAFSHNTNTSTPSLFGGYEYMPNHINERDDESLQDKQNEALSVLPSIFNDEDYTVTVCDPPYAGKYEWVPDVSIYDDYENVSAYVTEGAYASEYDEMYAEKYEEVQQRNFIYYSIFRCAPLALQGKIYDSGAYRSLDGTLSLNQAFFKSYSVMCNLINLSETTEDEGTFLMMQNSMTHEPVYLSVPDYEPSMELTKGMETTRVPHYMVNVSAWMKLADWFNWMRENDVWDNTKIIIVSDHGRDLDIGEEMDFDGYNLAAESYNALLMVKDFGATEFTSSDEFMTIGDVATLATDEVIENPVNPFTGNAINSDAKEEEPMYVTTTGNWDTQNHHGNRFDTEDGRWFIVSDNIFDQDNWQMIEDPVAAGLEPAREE